jgi:HNH endonuclease
MKALGFVAAAAIALAPLAAVATTPGVAQAAPFSDAGPSTQSSAPEQDSGWAADEEPTPPWWHSALRYGVLVTAVGLVAWTVGLSTHRPSGAPRIRSRPEPRPASLGALAARSTLMFPTIEPPDPAVKRRVLVEAAHRCAIPTCRNPTTEIAHIEPEAHGHSDAFENLIALCPDCQKKEIDRRSIRVYKRNLGILHSRYSDFERRIFDQIAETDRRSFIVEAGLEIPLLHAVNDGLLKRVEPSPVAIQRGEPTHYKYEVADAGLEFVSRYVKGADIS